MMGSALRRIEPVRSPWVAACSGVVAIALVTLVIEGLKTFVPVLALSVLYMFAVLPLAVFWGTLASVATAIGCMLAFNFFFLPPLYTLTLADPRNWFSLAVFVATAVVVSELATHSRRRATESELLAEIASSLLVHGSVSDELEHVADEVARVLRVESVRIELTEAAPVRTGPDTELLHAGDRIVGVLHIEGTPRRGGAARSRLVPALASLLGVAIDRERLEREAFEAAALRESDALKTALLRTVSHDLRSPLMTILTSASALAQADLVLDADDRYELLAAIRTEAQRLDRIVGNLLDLSRLQAGAARPETAVCALDDLVVQALADVGDSSRIDVMLPAQSLAVRADPHQIERALANLLENALKYSPANERVRLQVSGTASEVHIRVIDHGRGLAPYETERIFEAFQRGPETAGVRGAGLGLAIARGFAEANGGRVWAESRRGQGATFVLALPVESAEAVPA
jgi:two-component system, OmpR family, sensor histidine kinase KdpD